MDVRAQSEPAADEGDAVADADADADDDEDVIEDNVNRDLLTRAVTDEINAHKRLLEATRSSQDIDAEGVSGARKRVRALPAEAPAAVPMRATAGLDMCMQFAPSSAPLVLLFKCLRTMLDECGLCFATAEGGKGALSLMNVDNGHVIAVEAKLEVLAEEIFLPAPLRLTVKVASVADVIADVPANCCLDLFTKTGEPFLYMEWYAHVSERGRERVRIGLIDAQDPGATSVPLFNNVRCNIVDFRLPILKTFTRSAKKHAADDIRFKLFEPPARQTRLDGQSIRHMVLSVSFAAEIITRETLLVTTVEDQNASRITTSLNEDERPSDDLLAALGAPTIDVTFSLAYLTKILSGMERNTIALLFNAAAAGSNEHFDLLGIDYMLSPDKDHFGKIRITIAPKISDADLA